MLFRNLQHAIYIVPALLIALTFHEYAHGMVASLLGDQTARHHGRLTLNPIKHLDPVGLLMLLIAGFGWAKPVPVNPLYFKGNRRRGMLLVAIAGPATNFILALVAGIGIAVTNIISYSAFSYHLAWFFNYLLMFNVFLGVFNLLPIPPLDGSKILFNILPPKYSQFLFQLEQYGFLILIILLVTGIHRLFLTPAAYAIIDVIAVIVEVLVSPFL